MASDTGSLGCFFFPVMDGVLSQLCAQQQEHGDSRLRGHQLIPSLSLSQAVSFTALVSQTGKWRLQESRSLAQVLWQELGLER